MRETETLRLRGASGALAAVLHFPARPPAPLVIACHGLLSSKDSPKYLELADALAGAGFTCARFDFSGCGESEGALSETTVARRVADLHSVAEALSVHRSVAGGLGLVGSSLGGFVALCHAKHDPRVRAVVAWATPAHLKDLGGEGELLLRYGLGRPLLEELHRAGGLEAPDGVPRCLILHGTADALVPEAHAHALYARAAEPKSLEILPGADHVFSDPAARAVALSRTVAWFTRFLLDGAG
ncbi:MAG TPA: alpha/beta fold hydrolase [Candidatus Methylomirabilis sp.]|nr:alpha/beta fold hydrolase [Candidatus Methylomirabilis sp.]